MSYEAIYKGQPLLGGGPSDGGVPAGCILIWSGTADNIPDGWALCDGQNGRPDLRDRFVLGAGTSHAVGDSGGSEEVTLTVEQMPRHAHNMDSIFDDYTDTYSRVQRTNGALSTNVTTKYTGGSQPHPNMPPYYALCYIIKL